MSNRRVVLAASGGGHLLLTSSIGQLAGGRAVALLAAQPDARRPGEYRLEAAVVSEPPVSGALRLIARWEGGERTAMVDGAGCARISGIPAAVVQALRAGDQQALHLQIEATTGELDALG